MIAHHNLHKFANGCETILFFLKNTIYVDNDWLLIFDITTLFLGPIKLARWIWSTNEQRENDAIQFREIFEIPIQSSHWWQIWREWHLRSCFWCWSYNDVCYEQFGWLVPSQGRSNLEPQFALATHSSTENFSIVITSMKFSKIPFSTL